MTKKGKVMGTYEQDDEGYIRSPEAMRRYKAERAVIEKAKEFERLFTEPGLGHIDRDVFVKTRVRLLNAVDELRTAEKGKADD